MERLTIYLALAAILGGVAVVEGAKCFDCWYWTVSHADDNCNTATEFHKVDNATCEGKCYTNVYQLAGSTFVSRGCDDECKNGPTQVDKVPTITVNKTCCDGNHCNTGIVASAGISKPSILMLSLFAAALLFSLK